MGTLATADPKVRTEIMSFITNPTDRVVEYGQKGATEVGYNILLPKLEKNP